VTNSAQLLPFAPYVRKEGIEEKFLKFLALQKSMP